MPGTIPNITWLMLGNVSESGKSRDFWTPCISGSGETESFSIFGDGEYVAEFRLELAILKSLCYCINEGSN
jgi:hypothetical protein